MAATTAQPLRYQPNTSTDSSARANMPHPPTSAPAPVPPTPLIFRPGEYEDIVFDPDEEWIQKLRKEKEAICKDQSDMMHKAFLDDLAKCGPDIASDDHNRLFNDYRQSVEEMKRMMKSEVERIIDGERTTRLWSRGDFQDSSKIDALREEQEAIYQTIQAAQLGSGYQGRSAEEVMREQVVEVEEEDIENSATASNWQQNEQQRILDHERWKTNARANAGVRERQMQDQLSFAEQEVMERIRAERSAQILEEARMGKEALRGTTSAGVRTTGNSNSNAPHERQSYANRNAGMHKETFTTSTSTFRSASTSGGGSGSTKPTSVAESTAPPLVWNPNEPSPSSSQSSTSTATARPAQRPMGSAYAQTPLSGSPMSTKSGGGIHSDEQPARWIPPGAQLPPSRKPSMQFNQSGAGAGPTRKPSMQFDSGRTGAGPARKSSMLFGPSPSPYYPSIPEESPRDSPRQQAASSAASSTTTANATSSAPKTGPQPLPTAPPVNFPPRQTPPTSLPRETPPKSSSLPPRQTPQSSLPPRQNTFPSYPASASANTHTRSTSASSSATTKTEPSRPQQPTRSFSASFASTDAPQHPSVHANGNANTNAPRSFSATYSTSTSSASGTGAYSSASGAAAAAATANTGTGASFSSPNGAAVPPYSSASGNGSGPYTATNKGKYSAQTAAAQTSHAPYGGGAKTTTSTGTTAGFTSSTTSSASASHTKAQAQGQASGESFSTTNDEARAQKRTQYQAEQQRLAEEEAKRRENENNERRAEEAKRRGEERRRQEELAREAQRREQERKARAARAASGGPAQPQKIDEPVIDVWNAYEQQWSAMANASHLRFRSIPWPVMLKVEDPEQLLPVQIAHFILNPQHSASKVRKDRLKEALLRWHPDRFETKWLSKVVEEDREAVKDGVGRVVRALNELLNPIDLFG